MAYLAGMALGGASGLITIVGLAVAILWSLTKGAWATLVLIVLTSAFSRWIGALGARSARAWYESLPSEEQGRVIMWSATGGRFTEPQR